MLQLPLGCAIVGLSRCADDDQAKLADDAVMMAVLSVLRTSIDAGTSPSVLNASASSTINTTINGLNGYIFVKHFVSLVFR
ncbi:MAG: hypothetical protein J6568_03165 [Snodgrassella sp.]|nr:hypothetical protein [Snodgrassella sp.]